MNTIFSFRKICILCEQNKPDTQEHIFPKWLIRRTSSDKTGIRLKHNKKPIYPLKLTYPICYSCNQKLNNYLEIPTQQIFDNIENGKGMNDYDADVLVRWMWKMQKIFYIIANPRGCTSLNQKLIEKLIYPLDEPRERITLAISCIRKIDPTFKDRPLGLDVNPMFSGVLSAGVFSKVALIVSLTKFAHYIPNSYSQYRFSKEGGQINEPRLMIPCQGFKDDIDAVCVTRHVSNHYLLDYHEIEAINQIKQLDLH